MRNAVKFARKYWLAHLLAGRLFWEEKDAEELKLQIFATAMYKNGDQMLRQLTQAPTPELQQWVRHSFVHDAKATEATKRFFMSVVKPCLTVSVAGVPAQMVNMIGRYLTILGGAECSEVDAANMKIACSALKGELSHHPFVQGLCLQARRLVDKRLRGIETMQGRRSRETEAEALLISDAGISLAMFAANSSLAREFGLSAASLKINLDILKERSLPSPALALNWKETITENFILADQRFKRVETTPRCDLEDWSIGLFSHNDFKIFQRTPNHDLVG